MIAVALCFPIISIIGQGLAAHAVISSIAVTEDLRITEGNGPSQVAVNPKTHLVYVTNPTEQKLTIIKPRDALSLDNSPLMQVVDTIEVPNAFGIAINPSTNMIYVSGYTASSLYVINGSTNRVTSIITVGTAPRGVAVNPSTNMVYVANFASDSISVIDGSTNTVIHSLKVSEGNMQDGPRDLAINKETNRLYVANWLSNSVSILDLSTNMIVERIMDVGETPSELEVNERTGKVYVLNQNSVSVVDMSDNNRHVLTKNLIINATERDDSRYIFGGIAVNQKSNLVYLTNRISNSTTVIDGDNDDFISNDAFKSVAKSPTGIAVDQDRDSLYIVGQSSNSLTLVHGPDNQTSTIQIAGWPSSIALNPDTGMIYVGNFDTGTVSVLNATARNNLIDTISFGQRVMDVEVDDKTNIVYVLISTVEPDGFPKGTLVVVDGNTNKITERISVPALAPSSIAMDRVTNMLYIGHDGYNHHTITVIDGSTNKVLSSIYAGYNYPQHIAVNEKLNKLYVAISEPATVLMLNGSANDATEDSEPTKIPVSGSLADIAVNPETDMVYVTDYWNSTIYVIDGSTGRVAKTLTGFGASPTGVSVNPKTNTIYVTNNAINTLTIIDGSSNEIVAELVTDENPAGVAVNPESGAIYVTNQISGTVLMYEKSQLDGSRAKMIPFSIPVRVVSTTNTEDQQTNQDDSTRPLVSGRAQDVRVTDITIKPQENMLVITYSADESLSSEDSTGRGNVKAGIIEVTLPTSMISDIYRIGMGGLPYPQNETISNETVWVVDDYESELYYYLTNPPPTYAYTNTSLTSNTIKFIVPLAEENSVEILGAKVVPEFSSFSLMIAGAAIVGAIAGTRYAVTNRLRK